MEGGAHTYAFSRLNETGVESSVGKISRAPVPVLNICSANEETNLHEKVRRLLQSASLSITSQHAKNAERSGVAWICAAALVFF